MKSVYLEECEDASNCVKMVWNGNTLTKELEETFSLLQEHLNHAASPVYVIVILNNQVNFPLHITGKLALGAHKHPNLKSWLVIGKDNMLARIIANVLSSVSQDEKIHWFNSMAEIQKYVESHNETTAPTP